MIDVELLRGVAGTPLLVDLDASVIRAIAEDFEEGVADEGDHLVRQGGDTNGIGLILEGQAVVMVDGREHTRLGPGDLFGEISALLDEPVSADVVALSPVRVATLPASRTEAFLTTHPSLAYRLLQAEARRLQSPERWYAGSAVPWNGRRWAPASWRAPLGGGGVDSHDPHGGAAYLGPLPALARRPVLVSPAEVRALSCALREVAAGHAFVLHAGERTTGGNDTTAGEITAGRTLLLQMAVVLTYSAGVPVVRVGKLASAPSGLVDEDRLSTFHAQAASEVNLLRALTTGAFADLSHAHLWNENFIAAADGEPRHRDIAIEIQLALQFARACRINLAHEPRLTHVRPWTSHELANLAYEEAFTRREASSGDWYGGCSHVPSTAAVELDQPTVELLSGILNPVACRLGPGSTPAEVVELCERLNPDRVPGKLTLVCGVGAARVSQALPPLFAVLRDSGHPVIWACDPVDGNTVTTRHEGRGCHYDDVVTEVQGFFAACASEAAWPGGLHLPVTTTGVGHVVTGSQGHVDSFLASSNGKSPRLDARQAIDLAFRVAELMQA